MQPVRQSIRVSDAWHHGHLLAKAGADCIGSLGADPDSGESGQRVQATRSTSNPCNLKRIWRSGSCSSPDRISVYLTVEPQGSADGDAEGRTLNYGATPSVVANDSTSGRAGDPPDASRSAPPRAAGPMSRQIERGLELD